MSDAEHQKWREAGWKRPMPPENEARLRGWLDTHPEARMEWEAELELTRLLHEQSDVPMSSNFTAQVLQAVDRQTNATLRAGRWRRLQTGWIHSWAARAAITMLVAAFGVTSFWSYRLQRKALELTQVANAAQGMEIMGTMSVLPPQAFEDFDAIRQLTYVPQQAPPDLELLAALE